MYVIKDNERYDLPKYSALTGLSVTTRNSAESKNFLHGGVNTSDNKVDYREIEISTFINGKNQRDYFSQVDELKRYMFRQDQKLYITEDRYINISSVSSIEEEFESGFYLTKGTLTITLMALDPFTYDAFDQQQSVTITVTGQQFYINNPGNIDTPIEITIAASSTLSSISLVNTTDNDRTISYSDANFTSGKSLVVSSADGTVKLNGSSTINKFSGTFLTLLAGDNLFTWTGGTCTITMSYSVRWL